MRRKHWEFRSQAVQVLNAYAEAMTPPAQGTQGNGATPPPRKGNQVSGDAMLKMLGAKGLT